jgi:hypothetical protein
MRIAVPAIEPMLTDHDMNWTSRYVAEMIAGGGDMGVRQSKHQGGGSGPLDA